MAKPEIRLKGFQGEWERYNMSDVLLDMYNGQTPYRAESSFWNGDINWISSGDLNRGIVEKSSEKITEKGKDNAHLRLVPKGTFVMAITGLEAAGTRGNCGILGIDTTMNQSCMALFPDSHLLDTQFLFQWYRAFSEDLGIRLTQGTKQQSFNSSIIKKIELNLPNINEQKALGSCLFAMDKTILSISKKIESLKQFKSACYVSMYPQTGERIPHVRFKGFKGNWDSVRISDCLEDVNVRNYPIQTDFVLSLTVKDGVIPYSEKGHIGNRSKGDHSLYKLAYPDTIVLNSMNILIGAIGLCDYFGCVSPVYYVFKCKDNTDRRFIFDIMSSKSFQNELRQIASGMMEIRQKVPINELLEKKILIPCKEEQQQIASFFRSLDSQISLQEQRLEKLKQIKSACLDKMFV